MKNKVKIGLAVATLAVAGCGSDGGRAARVESDPVGADVSASPPAAPASACREPSGQEKGALRFAVRRHDPGNDAGPPWARVRRHGVNYMAAVLDAAGPRLVVLVRYPETGRYLAGMRAVNGTARTFTDLPEAGASIPAAGAEALACVQ